MSDAILDTLRAYLDRAPVAVPGARIDVVTHASDLIACVPDDEVREAMLAELASRSGWDLAALRRGVDRRVLARIEEEDW